MALKIQQNRGFFFNGGEGRDGCVMSDRERNTSRERGEGETAATSSVLHKPKGQTVSLLKPLV